MSPDQSRQVYATVAEFYRATQNVEPAPVSRIVHCLNPFPAQPGSEHDRAQRMTFSSMSQARTVARHLVPNLRVDFAKITDEDDVPSDLITFDYHLRIDRTVSDLGTFRIARPLPIMMDLLTAVPLEPNDILVFTNVDISLSPGFYPFLKAIFRRGVDCAIINRRTVSNAYADETDIDIAAAEIGTPHPGFDCFALRGHLRNKMIPYDSCVGIGNVMLPLVHQIFALAERPVILTDAHATFHLGDDQQWRSEEFADYQAHNQAEVHRVFQAILDNPITKERLLDRLSVLSGAYRNTMFNADLRAQAGWTEPEPQGDGLPRAKHARGILQRLFRG